MCPISEERKAIRLRDNVNMRRYDIALFDLDGTLSESEEGILDSVRTIFKETKRPLPAERVIRSFIGPPMYDSLIRCGFEHEDARKAMEIYKRSYIESGIYKNKLYEGIDDVLRKLKSEGVRLGVASSKYQGFTDRIINMLGIEEFFDMVGGSTLKSDKPIDGCKPRWSKLDVINYVIDDLRTGKDDRIVMIGDTGFDAEGAAGAGVDFIGCIYGYGTKEDMEENYSIGTPIFAENPMDIIPIIIG